MSKPRTNQEIIDDELEELPEGMRERVSRLIDKRVEWRVQQHMKALREELDAEIEEQTDQNQDHINHYQTLAREAQELTELKMTMKQQ